MLIKNNNCQKVRAEHKKNATDSGGVEQLIIINTFEINEFEEYFAEVDY